MRFVPVTILSGGDMSLTSVHSIGIDLSYLFTYSIQAVFTGSPVGTLKLQVSNDNVPVITNNADPAANVTHWTDYTGSSYSVSAAGDFTWNVWPSGYHWVRMVYTKVSGTGSLTAVLSGK